jgi:alkylation response protein AidB-like acyl-CoA dehydrogenase
MDFELDSDQQAIADAVDALLSRHAGPARAIALAEDAAYDEPLEASLVDAGFGDVAAAAGAGPLVAALIVEAVAAAAGTVGFAARALVAPALGLSGDDLSRAGPVAVCEARPRGPVRYAAAARTLLVLDRAADVARVVALAPGVSEPVRSSFGYPMGWLPEGLGETGESLGPGTGTTLERWWRLALALEAVGTMAACLDVTTRYVSDRKQFGQPIGSFQAVQHRLAELAIEIEASRWLAREAAWQGAPAEAVATAAGYALSAAGSVFSETHQLSGAIGFTREHDLHVFSMRLQALRLELGGVGAHRRAAAAARWGAT